jgi:hypothetical protein
LSKISRAPSIEVVFQRIEQHAGALFRQIRGAEFRYIVIGGHVVVDRTNQQIPKSHFAQALGNVPLSNTRELQALRGPSYIYAILMDDRIRAGEW